MSSSLSTMVASDYSHIFEDWVFKEVQDAPDHMASLSSSSLSRLPLIFTAGVVAESVWLEMHCQTTNKLVADIPVTLKLHGIRPLLGSGSLLGPCVHRRSQWTAFRSTLNQLEEATAENSTES